MVVSLSSEVGTQQEGGFGVRYLALMVPGTRERFRELVILDLRPGEELICGSQEHQVTAEGEGKDEVALGVKGRQAGVLENPNTRG